MSKPIEEILTPKPEALFGRVVSILEQSQGNVVRSVILAPKSSEGTP